MIAPTSRPRPHLCVEDNEIWTPSEINRTMASVMTTQILKVLEELTKENLNKFKLFLNEEVLPGCPTIPQGPLDECKDLTDVVKLMKSSYDNQMEEIAVEILKKIDRNDLAGILKSDPIRNVLLPASQELKTKFKMNNQCIFQGLEVLGNQTPLPKIYTKLLISEGDSGGINGEHEIRKGTSKNQTALETAIPCNKIFHVLSGQETRIKTVLTKGIAGIGKTYTVQKFILDWAEEKANRDIEFVFPFSFRDLNQKMKRKPTQKINLMKLLQQSFPQLNEIKHIDKAKVVFIFDGLDECRLPLDFKNNESCNDVTKTSSLDVLLTSLIQGNLLPSAFLWITSRPAAAKRIPPQYINRVTEIRGFTDPQKEEYFKNRIENQNEASIILSHIKMCPSLSIMCHMPVFCWISASVLETMLGKTKNEDLPKTLTEMFTQFVIIQTKRKHQKYDSTSETNASDTKIILKLGKLAFQRLIKDESKFLEKDLSKSKIDVNEASLYSGVFTQFLRKERGLHQEEVYCFVHLSVQEYLAALFAFHSCVNENKNVFRANQGSGRKQLSDLHRSAVDEAFESENGHLDLFLRFLLGLSMDSIQTSLKKLLIQRRNPIATAFKRRCPQTECRSESIAKTVQYIKMKVKQESSAQRTINLFHCLIELNSNSLVVEIKNALRSGKLSDTQLEPDQCSALAFVLSEEIQNEFDLKTYKASAEGRTRLVPVVRNCKKAILSGCDLTEQSCDIVASALQSSNSPLTDLDLSFNHLTDSGVKLLCAGLRHPNCQLQRLRLSSCDLTEKSCDFVASALRSSKSPLRDLDLSFNDLRDSGVNLLCAELRHPDCKLQRLGLSGCRVTQRGCGFLASALRSNPSHLRELDLRYNQPGDSGVRVLSAAKPDTLALLVDHEVGSKIEAETRKYSCQLTLDPNTPNRELSLSEENRKVTHTPGEEEPYPDHPERFQDVLQVLCRESVSERCYWEVEYSVPEKGWVSIAVTYKGIGRKGEGSDCGFGWNANSWSLECEKHSYSDKHSYSVRHNKKQTPILAPTTPYHRAGVCEGDDGEGMCVYRVGVCVDRPAGILSFYNISESNTLTLLHRFHTQFTEHTPLCAGFGVQYSSVSLCRLE